MCNIIYHKDVQACYTNYHHKPGNWLWYYIPLEDRIEYHCVVVNEGHLNVCPPELIDFECNLKYLSGRLNEQRSHATFTADCECNIRECERVLNILLNDNLELRTIIDFTGKIDTYQYAC